MRATTSATSRSCNAVGAQDELVFDGHSVVLDDEGEVLARAPGFEEALLVVDIDRRRQWGGGSATFGGGRSKASGRLRPTRPSSTSAPLTSRPAAVEPTVAPLLDDLEQMRLALELGLGDYVRKNGFTDVVLGVSGGIDSALTAAIASEALGPERVHCVSMPSRYSSEGTRGDARLLAESLGAEFLELPIEGIVASFEDALAGPFAGREQDLTEENLQARIRGVQLMALSNKFGWLVVATGNKSELSVGYATLYGDMAGGFALLKDVYKTDVFRLARHLNERAGRELIPQSIIDRAPSAELRADQLDEDSLPPYSELDRVLEAYVEEDQSREDLDGGRIRSRGRRPRAGDDRQGGVQATAGPARSEAAPEGVRPRLAFADHESLARLEPDVERHRRRAGHTELSEKLREAFRD